MLRTITYLKYSICEMLYFRYLILFSTVSNSKVYSNLEQKHMLLYMNIFKLAIIEHIEKAYEFYHSFIFKCLVRSNTEIVLFYNHN